VRTKSTGSNKVNIGAQGDQTMRRNVSLTRGSFDFPKDTSMNMTKSLSGFGGGMPFFDHQPRGSFPNINDIDD